jgi:chromate reductase
MKRILVINGSASANSSNQQLVHHFAELVKGVFSVAIFNELKTLPHFDPELSTGNTPKKVLDFRRQVETADGIVICTPEYVFSIPSGLKNAIEWCVATTVFSGKPTGLITASANGEKGHAELQLIMQTLMADFTPETTLLVPGVKGKIDQEGNITDLPTKNVLAAFTEAFIQLVNREIQ